MTYPVTPTADEAAGRHTQDYMLPAALKVEHSLNSLDGSVQRQGVPLSSQDWLDLGSATWRGTPDQDKARAYQAAKTAGWTDAGLKRLALQAWGPRVDEDVAEAVLEVLRALAAAHPCEVQEVYKDNSPEPVFTLQGCERTAPFPK